MINIAIVASGTRGDVQPYIALGKGLQRAGYDVHLLASDDFATLVMESGLTFESTGSGTESRLQSSEWRKVMESGNFLTVLSKMQAEMKQTAVEQARIMPQLLKGRDLILTGMAGLTGVFSIAAMLNIPVIQTHVFPFTPTREFSSPLVAELPFGGLLNHLSFHAMQQVFWQSFKVSDATTRQTLGLPKGRFLGPYRELARRHEPVLYGYSAHVLPRPRDWNEKHHVTGYWFLGPPATWTPPADLMQFLEAGKPPVYIGFGSMGSQNPAEVAEMVLKALELSEQRGVLASGWGGLQVANVPEHVHLVSSIPHSWLFERMAAVVHHGGAGTTAAGLRAGVPSLVVPFGADQPFWGKRVADLGVGPAPIPRKKLTSNRLAQAMLEAVTNTTMRQKAHTLGQQIRAEGGVEKAVAIVEHFVADHLAPRRFV